MSKPIDLSKLNWERIKFLSESAKEIWAFNKRELDWMTSKVVLPEEPLLYSAVIPSLAISAALTCNWTELSKLLFDWKFDQALATLVWFCLISLSKVKRDLFSIFLFLFNDARFFPPD